jgi:hypothetical protein
MMWIQVSDYATPTLRSREIPTRCAEQRVGELFVLSRVWLLHNDGHARRRRLRASLHGYTDRVVPGRCPRRHCAATTSAAGDEQCKARECDQSCHRWHHSMQAHRCRRTARIRNRHEYHSGQHREERISNRHNGHASPCAITITAATPASDATRSRP